MTKIIQITNVAPTATADQMRTLFGYLGRIEDVYIYPAGYVVNTLTA